MAVEPAAMSIAPLLLGLIVLVWSMPVAAPIGVLGILPAALIFIGLVGAVVDYMAAHGVKESMRQARDSPRQPETGCLNPSAEDPPGDAQERVTDMVHQLCERFLVTGAGSLHYISVHSGLR